MASVRVTPLQKYALYKLHTSMWGQVREGRHRVALRALHQRAPELVERKVEDGVELFRATERGRTRVISF